MHTPFVYQNTPDCQPMQDTHALPGIVTYPPGDLALPIMPGLPVALILISRVQ